MIKISNDKLSYALIVVTVSKKIKLTIHNFINFIKICYSNVILKLSFDTLQ